MNTIKLVSKLFLFLLIIYNSESFATPLYSSCSEKQTTLIHDLKLLSNETLKTGELQERSDCILFNSDHVLIVTANTIPTQEYQYQMKVYLINTNNNKIVLQYNHPQTISESNGKFSSIKFDHIAYSNLPEQHVIGLKTHFYNIGEHSFDVDKFNLFRVQFKSNSQKYNIQWVLRNIMTNVQSSWRNAFGCDNGTNDDIKSIFILQNSQNHQLQDILLKQRKKSVDTDEKCKTIRTKKAKQQLLKFNGEFYQINPKQLLISEDLKDE